MPAEYHIGIQVIHHSGGYRHPHGYATVYQSHEGEKLAKTPVKLEFEMPACPAQPRPGLEDEWLVAAIERLLMHVKLRLDQQRQIAKGAEKADRASGASIRRGPQ